MDYDKKHHAVLCKVIADKAVEYYQLRSGIYISWIEREYRAKMTEHINYDCGFVDGFCKTQRKLPPEKRIKSCCCVRCYETYEYLAQIPTKHKKKS